MFLFKYFSLYFFNQNNLLLLRHTSIPEKISLPTGHVCINLINGLSFYIIMLSEEELKRILFPHNKIRDIQVDLALAVDDVIKKKKHMVVHAPTGLGKTAATIAPALANAIEKDLTVFFLTSRHTQHKIVIDTLKLIRDKHGIMFGCVDIVGKKWMCPVPGVDNLNSGEFSDYCKSQRVDMKCEFYANTNEKSNKLSLKAKKLIGELRQLSPLDTDSVMDLCSDDKICPYEISIALARKAKVIIGDYYYIFNETIRNNLFNRIGLDLEKCVIIVDEGHNLPTRIRELLTDRLTTIMLSRAIKEAKKYGYNETISNLQLISDAVNSLSSGLKEGEEKLASKDDFIRLISKSVDYDDLIADLEFIAEAVKSSQKQSYIGSIAYFLEQWAGNDDGFTRIVSLSNGMRGPIAVLSYRCLDPSIVSGEIISQSHSTILMSGTLTPTDMYRNLLGFPENTEDRSFKSPFPIDNRLSLIIPKTTTKFTARNEKQFMEISKICAEIVNEVPGNSAIFFPSYYLRDSVNRYFTSLCRKTTFLEMPTLTKQEKSEMLAKFKQYKDVGAVLLGAASGSFGEGIDLPGDLLKCVVIVGLPLQKPDLETKQLISYYDLKFGKGWDYGYLFPAFNKSLQNAGRCIRSKKDKGVTIFLDERYNWPNYFRCFPADVGIRTTHLYIDRIRDFFNRS